MDLVGLINKNKNKVFNTAVIILGLIIAFNIYNKQMSDIESLKVKISEEGKKNQVLDNISKLGEKVDSYRQLLAKKEASSSMSDINNIARDAGVKIASIKPSGEETLPEYTKYIFDLSVSAPDYDTLAKFINKIEAYQDIYIVDNFDIQSSSYNKDKVLNANLRISAVAMLE